MTLHTQRQLLRPRHRLTGQRAFTLIELIVVMSIIILVLSVILPVVNTLLGNRNVQNTQNQIAGYIATARADAIQNRTPIGVCFFIDPATRQETLVEVQPIQLADWGNNTGNTWDNGWYPNEFAPIDIAGNRIVDSAAQTGGSLTAYRDALVLPLGVGVAVVESPLAQYPPLPNTSPTYRWDQLVRLGVIMFDDTGARMSMQYAIPGPNTSPIPNALAGKLQLSHYLEYTIPNVFTTGAAFYIYDHNIYSSQVASSGNQYTDGDLYYSPSWATYFSNTDKVEEDNWIIANGVELTVSPYDGSLLKAK